MGSEWMQYMIMDKESAGQNDVRHSSNLEIKEYRYSDRQLKIEACITCKKIVIKEYQNSPVPSRCDEQAVFYNILQNCTMTR